MSKAAVVIENEPTGIVEFNQFKSDLAEYKSKYENVVYDLTVPAQEKQARSDRLAIGKKVAELDRVHAAIKAPLKAQVDLLDGERKWIKDELLSVQDRIKSQIAEHESKLQAIEDGLNARVEAIKALSVFEFQPTSAHIQERLDTLSVITIDESFVHHAANALLAHKTSLATLTALLEVTTKAEAEAIELARLRQESEAREREEREAKIAADAKQKAEQDAAESIERERQAKLKAEQDARDTAERAKKQASEAAVKAEQAQKDAVAAAEKAAQQKAEQVERDRLAAAEKERKEAEKREANKKHCAAINNTAATALVECAGISMDQAKAVITTIAKGSVPAVSIRY
jgi:colicin import membrane protein